MSSSKYPPLAPETWLNILQHLTRAELGAMRLTCKLLANLAKLHMFCSFDMLPLYTRRTGMCKERQKARLEFWSSNTVAHLVRHAHIVRRVHVVAPAITRKFFQTLSHFVNLRSMDLLGITIDDFAVEQLCQLENLTAMTLADCTLSTLNPSRACLKLSNIGITAFSSISAEKHISLVGWWMILQPNHLREIELRNYTERRVAESHLRALSAVIPFPTMEEVKLTLQGCASTIRLLVAMPAYTSQISVLHILEVFPGDSNTGFINSCLMPNLRKYTGPGTLLNVFLPGQALRDIDLGYGCVSASSFLSNVCGLPPAVERLGWLSFTVEHITEELLVGIFSRFAHLTFLRIRCQHLTPDEADDTEANAQTRPYTPRVRFLFCRLCCRNTDISLNLQTLRNALLSLHLPARIEALDILYRAPIDAPPNDSTDEVTDLDTDWGDSPEDPDDMVPLFRYHGLHPDSDGPSSNEEEDKNVTLAKHLFKTHVNLQTLELNLGHLERWGRGGSVSELWSCKFRRTEGNAQSPVFSVRLRPYAP